MSFCSYLKNIKSVTTSDQHCKLVSSQLFSFVFCGHIFSLSLIHI